MASETQTAQFLLNAQRMRVGVILALVGTVLGAAGSLVAGVELAQATKKWLSESGAPPSEVALAKMHQAVQASHAARHAAREAWLHNGAFVPSGAEGLTTADT